MKPHKHRNVILAYADGAEVQYRPDDDYEWIDIDRPTFDEKCQYRVKQKQQADDVVLYHVTHEAHMKYAVRDAANLRLTFDGTTGKLKSAEVLK